MSDPPFTLHESARRLGHFRWLEAEVFSLLGHAAAAVPDAEVTVFLAGASRHHGWHAELLGERLPTVRDLSPDRQTVPPNDAVAALLASLRGATTVLDVLVPVYEVIVPALIGAYERHLARCTPVADTAVMRTVRLIVDDLTADAAEGARLIADRRSAADEQAADLASETASRLAAAGGISAS